MVENTVLSNISMSPFDDNSECNVLLCFFSPYFYFYLFILSQHRRSDSDHLDLVTVFLSVLPHICLFGIVVSFLRPLPHKPSFLSCHTSNIYSEKLQNNSPQERPGFYNIAKGWTYKMGNFVQLKLDSDQSSLFHFQCRFILIHHG